MRRGLIVSIAVMLVLSMAVPAGAKKQKPPPTESVVTMTFFDEEGLATTCDGSSIVMQANQGGGLVAAQPMLETDISVFWERGYPEPVSPRVSPLEGCHGWVTTEPAGIDVFGGSLWLDPGQSGTSVSLKWLFDYYWEYEIVRKGKRDRLTQTVLEMFDLSSEPMVFDWTSPEPQLVSGTFTLSWFQKIDSTIIEPFTPFGDVQLEFWLQVVPTP